MIGIEESPGSEIVDKFKNSGYLAKGCKFGRLLQHQKCKFDRSQINAGASSGSLLPIISMMQATDTLK